jgi:secreted trypsin-like serine protease
MKFITVLTFFCVFLNISQVYSIHNGHTVEPNSIPYMVLIIVKNSDHSSKCGGALVKVDRVLTAAHCLKGKDTAHVTVGAHRIRDIEEDSRQTQTVDADAMYPHPQWAPGKGHDVGIIQLPDAFELNEYVALVKLPYALEGYTFVGEVGKVSGWGRIDDEEDNNGALRAVENPIISNEDCRKHGMRIDSGNVCLSAKHGRRTCNGDSGSPLVSFVQKISEIFKIVFYIFV